MIYNNKIISILKQLKICNLDTENNSKAKQESNKQVKVLIVLKIKLTIRQTIKILIFFLKRLLQK
jgi:hypothetical protein